jgi:hypothetical protein
LLSQGLKGSNRMKSSSPDMNQKLFSSPARAQNIAVFPNISRNCSNVRVLTKVPCRRVAGFDGGQSIYVRVEFGFQVHKAFNRPKRIFTS